jgi:hypothetical protein
VDCAVGNDDIDNETFEAVPEEVESDSDSFSDIENTLPRIEVESRGTIKSQNKAKMGLKVAWAVPICQFSDMPQFQHDDDRYASVSRVPPQQRPWRSH